MNHIDDPEALLRRAAEYESRVPPAEAGPRTDDERMLLEKARELRGRAAELTAGRSAQAIDEGLAKLFIRLGPPPAEQEK